MNVSAVIPTRGDVDLSPILTSLPKEWEVLVWDNGEQTCWVYEGGEPRDEFSEAVPGSDLAVYGRYAAIEYASHDPVYTQDDDVIVSDPQAIVDAWIERRDARNERYPEEVRAQFGADDSTMAMVCNMPQEFRPHYPDSGLVGFGAAFHRDAPMRAFHRFFDYSNVIGLQSGEFRRRADNIFTALTPRVLVDVPKRDLDYASDLNRMWRQPDHEGEKQRMLGLARRVRDGR